MKHIAYLIVKSILSDLSEQEKKELSQWRSSSRHNRKRKNLANGVRHRGIMKTCTKNTVEKTFYRI